MCSENSFTDDIQTGSHLLHPFIKIKNNSGTEDIHYSVLYESLPKEFQVVAERELNETEEKKRKGIERLKEYMRREKLPNIDCNGLITVLRSSKYNMKTSETKLKSFSKYRSKAIEKLKETDLKKLEHVINNHMLGILPYRDKFGRSILFTQPTLSEDLFSMEDAAFCLELLCIFALTFPLTTVAGMVYIGECKTETPSVYYSILKGAKSCFLTVISFPLRIARADIINEMFIVKCFYNLIRPLLPAKIRDRVFLSGSDLKYLQKYYPPEILPEEFGGKMGVINQSFYKDRFLNFVKKLKAENLL